MQAKSIPIERERASKSLREILLAVIGRANTPALTSLEFPLDQHKPAVLEAYALHTGTIPRTMRTALRHVRACDRCRISFNEIAERNLGAPQGRGWWSGPGVDPYVDRVHSQMQR